MICAFCQQTDTRVTDSRLTREGQVVRRRRECGSCGQRFTTFEEVELSLPQVVKSGGEREAWSRSKLQNGIMRSIHKRPIAASVVDEALALLERELMGRGEREVTSEELGAWVMKFLRGVDQVAYVRYASIYRSFTDLDAFRDEIAALDRAH